MHVSMMDDLLCPHWLLLSPGHAAGLRLLPADQAQAIIDVCQASLEASPFLVTSSASASVISGQDEGLYAWISINYLMGRMQAKPYLPTFSILELGGASMQASFVIFHTLCPSTPSLTHVLQINDQLISCSHPFFSMISGYI